MGTVAQRSQGKASDVLVVGFGTTVAMWAIGYIFRMPPVCAPSWLLMGLLLTSLFVGGFFAGRSSARGWKAGLYGGALTAVLNLLILGSLLAGTQPNHIVPSALWWVPGSIIVAVVLSTVGAFVGRMTVGESTPERNWTSLFARVAATGTFFLLIVGGLVTSHRAGLAVVDWPNSFGYNMFLYPLSRMTGGIYYEHAHRLFGTLVGLTTLVLTIHLWRTEPRRWLRTFAAVALVVVIIQGILGGLRVTGTFTMSTSPLETTPNLGLAVVHGVLGQVFLAMLIGIAVFTSTTWVGSRTATVHPTSASERSIATFLVGIVIVQLVLGAIQRHLAGGLIIHISMAVLVFLVALTSGIRAWGIHTHQPLIQRIGKLLIIGVSLQIVLGIGALVGLGMESDSGEIPAVSIVLRTTHQAVGAGLLALSTMLMLWTRRLLEPGEVVSD